VVVAGASSIFDLSGRGREGRKVGRKEIVVKDRREGKKDNFVKGS
jgi:hypothetical protein